MILCKNDIPILGEGEFLDGDKIYAATGPDGTILRSDGITVPREQGYLERSVWNFGRRFMWTIFFVRPDLSKDSVEVRVGVINYTNQVKRDLDIHISIEPKTMKAVRSEVLRKK